MSEQFWWYTARASGIVAWLLLTAAVLWGIVLATDLFSATRRPAWLLDLHRWLGGLTVGFVTIHIAALVADSYIQFGRVDIVVPFASDYETTAVAYGVIATWVIAIVEATSLAMKRMPKHVWRAIHRTSAVAFWLGGLHGTFIGTDADNRLYAITSLVAIMFVMAALVYRLATRHTPKTRPARTPVRG